jgi:hypothetical protein
MHRLTYMTGEYWSSTFQRCVLPPSSGRLNLTGTYWATLYWFLYFYLDLCKRRNRKANSRKNCGIYSSWLRRDDRIVFPSLFFVCSLTTPFQWLRLYSIERRGDKWMMNWEHVEGIDRGLILRYYPSIYLEWLRKSLETLSQDSQSSGRYLNPRPPEYVAGMLITRPRRSVSFFRSFCPSFFPFILSLFLSSTFVSWFLSLHV